MRFSLITAALFLAAAAPAFARPAVSGEVITRETFAASNGSTTFAAELDVDVKFSEVAHSSAYNRFLAGAAHALYRQALDDYYTVKHVMWTTLTKEGIVREERLIEIVGSIQRNVDLLLKAKLLNDAETHSLRRFWVGHEISHLMDKYAIAQIEATHLPNLAFACHAYHFVVDAAAFTIAAVASIPGLVVIGITEAAHAVHRVLHHIKVTLGWIVHEIEEEFIYIGHKIHEWAHELKEKVEARWQLHLQHQAERWDRIKNFFHHSCETSDCVPCKKEADSCPANGLVLLESTEEVDVSIKVTQKEARYQVVQAVKGYSRSDIEFAAEVRKTETAVVEANWA